MGTNRHGVERAVRYQLTNPYAATFYWNTESGGDTYAANLLDISRGGLKLSVPIELKIDDVIQLRLANEESQLDLRESARVCWIQKDPDSDGWHVGCQIQGAIDEDVLRELATRGLLDRRNKARHCAKVEALAQWELRKDRVPVQILNLSSEGFCLAADEPTDVGSRVKLTFCDDNGESSHEILARSTWQKEFENGYMIGCELAVEDIFDLVGYFVDTSRDRSNSRSRSFGRLLLAGAAILTVATAIFLVWMVF